MVMNMIPVRVRALDDGAGVLPARGNRRHRPVRPVILADMKPGIGGRIERTGAVMDHRKAVNVLRHHILGASFPVLAAVRAAPRTVDLHARPDNCRIQRIEHDLRHPRPVPPAIRVRVILRKRGIAEIIAS